jgi:hypothetical protein
MLTNGDPSRNPAFRPRLLINTRIEDGEIRERAGLSQLNASAIHDSAACIRNIVPFNIPTPKKLWITIAGCPGLSASLGFSLATLDSEQEPEFQRAVYYNTVSAQIALGTFRGALHVGSDSALRKLQLILQPWGTENLAVSGSSQDTPLVSFSGFTVKCLLEFDGKFFIGLDGGAGASKIVTWDGVSVRDDKTGIDAPLWFAVYRVQNGGDAIVCGTSTGNTIYIRPTGDSPGTWTSIGSTATVQGIAYKDVLYMASGGANVSSWNGTTLTAAARAPASATAVRTVTVFNKLLYFGYDVTAPSAAAIVGKFDGSTWTDVERNLTTLFSGTTSIKTLAPYRGMLAAGVTRTAQGQIQVSPGTATSGTWTAITPNAIQVGTIAGLLAA